MGRSGWPISGTGLSVPIESAFAIGIIGPFGQTRTSAPLRITDLTCAPDRTSVKEQQHKSRRPKREVWKWRTMAHVRRLVRVVGVEPTLPGEQV